MDTKIKSINLLPKEYIVAQKISFYQKIVGVVVAVEVIGFIAGVVLPPKREVKETQEELLALKTELSSPKYAGVNKTLTDLENAKVDIQNWMTEYKNVKTDDKIGTSLLDSLTTRVPSGINIINLEVTDGVNKETMTQSTNIHIIGQSVTVDQVLNYLSVLETVYLPKDITSTYEYNKELMCYDFDFTIKNDIVKAPEVQEAASDNTEEATTSDEASSTGEEEQ